jgi:hypothetical protein
MTRNPEIPVIPSIQIPLPQGIRILNACTITLRQMTGHLHPSLSNLIVGGRSVHPPGGIGFRRLRNVVVVILMVVVRLAVGVCLLESPPRLPSNRTHELELLYV